MKLLITSAAELDLEEIEAYISSDNPIAADRFLQLMNEPVGALNLQNLSNSSFNSLKLLTSRITSTL